MLAYFADGIWAGHYRARHAGSPGHVGTGDSESISGKSRSRDIFDGGDGFDVLFGTERHDALLLEDPFSPPEGHDGPRLAGVELIATGDGNDLVGWGMAGGIWEAMMSKGEAAVRLSADGNVMVSAAASDIGTGTYTILGQLAAEVFDCPIDAVTVDIGRSDLPKTGVEGGSWTAATTGSAVQAAAKAVVKTLLGHAKSMENSPLAEASEEQVKIAEGRLVLETNH